MNIKTLVIKRNAAVVTIKKITRALSLLKDPKKQFQNVEFDCS